MLQKHTPPEWLGGSLPLQNAGKALSEMFAAISTLPFARLNLQHAVPRPPA
jgi:hypothetical protein